MSRRVLGVLGGGDVPPDMLRKWAESAEILIAADSGADRLMAVGLPPHVTIGDLDSSSPRAQELSHELIQDLSQSYTDCDKLLRLAKERGILPITLICLEGDRLDHIISSLSSIVNSETAPLVRIALRSGMGFFIEAGDTTHDLGIGRTVSLIPLTICAGVTTKGFKWELADATLEPGRTLSISNVTTQTCTNLTMRSGVLLLIAQMGEDEMPLW